MMPALSEALQPLLRQIESGALATAVRTSTFAYPVIEIAHLVALSTLFGSVLIVDLAVLTQYRRLPLEVWGVAVLRLTLVGFALSVVTGVLMFMARATDIALNPMFLLKLFLLALAGVNACLFHRRRGIDLNASASLSRAQALLSILIWIGVIACGRMIAYV